MAVTQQAVEEKIKTYIDPYLEQDLITAKSIKDIKVDGDKVTVDVQLGFPVDGYKAELAEKLKAVIAGSGASVVNICPRW